MNPALRERVLSRLIIEPGTGCLLWAGSVNNCGYGQTHDASGTLLVHRLMYEWFTGPIPEGLTIDHLCRVRRCASPAHLEAVTQRENTLRGASMMARRATQTHCLRGHPFSPDNTYRPATRPNSRYCRQCMRDRDAARPRVSGRSS